MSRAKARWERVRTPEGFCLQLRARNGVVVLRSKPRASRVALRGVLGAAIEATVGLGRRDPSKAPAALSGLPEVEAP